MKVLICEDNILALKTLSMIIKKAGFETDHAEDGNEAMQLLSEVDYDLVSIDVHLPYHSGLELVKYLRSDLKKQTPVIVVSAFRDPQIQKQAHELGVDEYVTKPIDPVDFVNKIRFAIQK